MAGDCVKSLLQDILDPRPKTPVFHRSGLATHSNTPNKETSNGEGQKTGLLHGTSTSLEEER
jgi:hypothetical protein